MNSNVYIEIDTSILLTSADKTFHTLFHIIQQMDVDANVWEASLENKLRLFDILGIPSVTLDRHISSLKQRELLVRNKRGLYSLNLEKLTVS